MNPAALVLVSFAALPLVLSVWIERTRFGRVATAVVGAKSAALVALAVVALD